MKCRVLNLFAAVAIAVLVCSTTLAESVTFQDGAINPLTGTVYDGTEDLTMFNHSSPTATSYANNNYGTGTILGTGNNPSNFRTLLRFDVTSLAGEYTSIDSVTLKLYRTDADASAYIDTAATHEVYRLSTANADWVEGTTYNLPQTGSSCWNYRKYGNPDHPITPAIPTAWASGVAGTDYDDYEGGPIASASYGPTAPVGWMDYVFTDTSFIGDWVAGNNTGLLIRLQEETSMTVARSYSSDYAEDITLRPQLVINYTSAGQEDPIAGDANSDGKVDGSDVTILAGNWQVGVDGLAEASWAMGDFNGDKKVDGSDVTILAGNWQAGVTAAASAVPEPSCIALLLMLALGLTGLRARRK